MFSHYLFCIQCSFRIQSIVIVSDEIDWVSEDKYEIPIAVLVLLSIAYGTISFLAVVGNSLVMWIIATSRRMQNVTNFFIANLALADIVIGLFAIPFQVRHVHVRRKICIRTQIVLTAGNICVTVSSSPAAKMDSASFHVRILPLRASTFRQCVGFYVNGNRDRSTSGDLKALPVRQSID